MTTLSWDGTIRIEWSCLGVDTSSTFGLGSRTGCRSVGSPAVPSGTAVTSGDSVRAFASATGFERLTLRCGTTSGPLRAAGVFLTGSTTASRPLAPFHGGRCCTGASRESSTGGGCRPQVDFFESASRSPARICLVRSFSCGNCISN